MVAAENAAGEVRRKEPDRPAERARMPALACNRADAKQARRIEARRIIVKWDRLRQCPLIERRHGTHPRDDRIEIGIAHPGIPGERHRRFQLASVPSHALRNGALDLRVTPGPDA
jgi:hypothetical protein